MPVIHVNVGDNYSEELKERLAKYDISFGELAREMSAIGDNTISVQQVSRWMNKINPTTGRLMQPSMKNIQRIEAAIISIRRKRQGKRSNK